ncbi:MAG: hypothetical protein JNJ64_04225 [Flavobacteriales bacterium]|nr:hypothetical protein [Flavobacteriales bacterium]
MNPIAVIAFLIGINGGAPATPERKPAKEEQRVEREQPKPGKGDGGAKRRGGWDYN